MPPAPATRSPTTSSTLIHVYTLLIILYIVIQLLSPRRHAPAVLARARRRARASCATSAEPFLRIFRRILPTFGALRLQPDPRPDRTVGIVGDRLIVQHRSAGDPARRHGCGPASWLVAVLVVDQVSKAARAPSIVLGASATRCCLRRRSSTRATTASPSACCPAATIVIAIVIGALIGLLVVFASARDAAADLAADRPAAGRRDRQRHRPRCATGR